jgi:hypothetical protein
MMLKADMLHHTVIPRPQTPVHDIPSHLLFLANIATHAGCAAE